MPIILMLHTLASIRQYIKFNLKLDNRLRSIVFIGLLLIQILFPRTHTDAFTTEFVNNLAGQPLPPSTPATETVFENTLPQTKVLPKKTLKVPVTAYNSLAGQTDSTPCIAARGYNLCEADEENVIAANFLPMGTVVKIPEIFGDREFTVVDRMNKRYYKHIDVWMRSHSDAKSFGKKYAMVEIY